MIPLTAFAGRTLAVFGLGASGLAVCRSLKAGGAGVIAWDVAPAKATEAQIKNGLTYREIPETTVVGAARVAKALTDYRKQTVKEGVYTLRLAFQPMDGDHMGTAQYSEFFLMSPAADDKKDGTMEAKALQEMSAKATNGHPCVWLLFPGKDAADEPKLVNKGEGHWVLVYKQPIAAGDKKGTMQIGLTLFGTSPAAQ